MINNAYVLSVVWLAMQNYATCQIIKQWPRLGSAVNLPFKNQNGEREADFINCVIWRQQAESLANWAQERGFDWYHGTNSKHGATKTSKAAGICDEVVANDFQLLEVGKDREGGQSQGYSHPTFQ